MRSRLAVPLTFGKTGRLGNMLWIIASTAGVAGRHGAIPAIPSDWVYRDVYQVPDDWYVDPDALDRFSNVVDHPDTQHLPERWREYLQDVTLFGNAERLVRDAFRLQPDARAAIDEIADRWFWMPADLEGQRGPVAAVHVRRTDNVTNEPGTINCLPRDYYEDAFGRITSHPSLVVFTDDPQYVEDAIGDHWPVKIYRGVPRSKEVADTFMTDPVYDWVDLAMLAGDRTGPAWDAVVISNSSYAWWGAWLSGCDRVFYPTYWWGEKLSGDGHDAGRLFTGLPWHKIECEAFT